MSKPGFHSGARPTVAQLWLAHEAGCCADCLVCAAVYVGHASHWTIQRVTDQLTERIQETLCEHHAADIAAILIHRS